MTLDDINYPLLGPYLKILSLFGFILKPVKPIMHFTVIFVPIAIYITLSMYIDMIYSLQIKDYKEVFDMLGLCGAYSLGLVKLLYILMYRRAFTDIIEVISKFERDQLNMETEEVKDLVNKYTKHTRKIFNIYFTYCFITTALIFVHIFVTYAINLYKDYENAIVKQYLRTNYLFDRNVYPYDIISILLDIGYQICFITSHICWDAVVVSIMCFFTGQLEILKLKASLIFSNDNCNDNIIEAHKQFLFIYRTAKSFNQILSPIMLIYFIFSFVYVCFFVVQYVLIESTFGIRLRTIASAIFPLLQLFIFYWHSNATFYKSQELVDSVYNSDWYNQKPSTRRSFLIFMTGLKQNIVFTAGPVHAMTTSTFITIIQGAYSFFTLFIKTAGEK